MSEHSHGHAHQHEHEHEHGGKPCTHEHTTHAEATPCSHAHAEHAHHEHGHAASRVSAELLEQKLRSSKLAPSHVAVIDESDGCGSKFSSLVVSNQFEGLALIERHRAVQELLSEEIAQIHAFQVHGMWSDGMLIFGAYIRARC
eukprot:scaffold200412_cov46-Tisochrysis_lutea.AAC.2